MLPIQIYQLGSVSLIVLTFLTFLTVVVFYLYKRRLTRDLSESYGQVEHIHGD